MNLTRFYRLIVFFFIAFSICLFTSSCNNASREKTIKIGAVLPLTGDVAAYGKDTKDGVDLAIAMANESQQDKKFEVYYEDSKGAPTTAVTALQGLLAAQSPIAVVGENISSSTAAMIPVCDRLHVLLLSPSASAPNLSGLSAYFFRVFPSDTEEGAFIAGVVAKQFPYSKVAIIYVNNDYGLGLKEIFNKNIQAQGLTILPALSYEKGAKDFKTLLTKLKQDAPDAVYIPGYYEDAGLLLKQAKELGINTHFFGSTAEEDPKLLAIAGSAAEGFQYPVSTGYDADSKDSTVSKFITRFKEKYNKVPGLVSALGYDCGRLLTEGMIKNGISADSIRSYLLTSGTLSGAAGLMKFDSKGDVHKPILLKKVANGLFTESN